jgi:hypothetical protein
MATKRDDSISLLLFLLFITPLIAFMGRDHRHEDYNDVPCTSAYQITRGSRAIPYETNEFREADGCVTFVDLDPDPKETGDVRLCGSYRIVTCKR